MSPEADLAALHHPCSALPSSGFATTAWPWLAQDMDAICGEHDITANNCRVVLYRAHMQMRECLERNGFQGQR